MVGVVSAAADAFFLTTAGAEVLASPADEEVPEVPHAVRAEAEIRTASAAVSKREPFVIAFPLSGSFIEPI
jgi:hypothetical protein